jgi:hypothetical protein
MLKYWQNNLNQHPGDKRPACAGGYGVASPPFGAKGYGVAPYAGSPLCSDMQETE